MGRWRVTFRLRNDKRPEGSRRGKYAMISNQVEAGWRHEGRELGHQVEGLEDDAAGAVAPAVPEAVKKPAAGQELQPLGGDRGTARVAAEPLQPEAVVGIHTRWR